MPATNSAEARTPNQESLDLVSFLFTGASGDAAKRTDPFWSEPFGLDTCQAGDWTSCRACSSSNRAGAR